MPKPPRAIRSGVVYFFSVRSVGGAVSDVDADATAYSYRDANFSVTAFGVDRRRLDALWDEMQPHFGLYLSFETDLRRIVSRMLSAANTGTSARP